MRDYEVTVIISANLEDEARDQLIERVGGWLKDGRGEDAALTVNRWGQRQLAYPIKKQTDGYYVLYETELDPTNITEIERNMTFVDDILRHLVVRKES